MSSMELVYPSIYPNGAGLWLARTAKAAVLRPPRRVEGSDWLAILILLLVAALTAYTSSLRIEQDRWEQAALAAFNERVIKAPDMPIFDFAAREKMAADLAGCAFIIALELLLVSTISLLREFTVWPTAALPISARVGRLADRWRGARAPPRPDPAHLRADAERCFRLAQGAVSAGLAKELEALGRALECEALEIERQDRRV